ncbi:hypothetical protein Taro_006164 [Colocasia esculenta]|uniref:Prolamin-like domain-containing protein n=1 Tax=Colocasia esculenta TaxID=4460 RepID=A0A843TRU1_COLES|nr:hypothetical protein [Colocasia esculenta]
MRKAHGLNCVLLLACAAATCSASYATATATEANPDSVDGSKLLVPGFPWWSSIVPIIGDPKSQECWRSLLGTESCVTSAFQSILAGRFGLSSECCAAIAALGDDCVRKMFSFPRFIDVIPGLIDGACGAFEPPKAAAPPAPVPGGRKLSGKIPF